uniref:Uncharacterized protein n=1 Tax=viral metagenome TaxID=1070528 RepID=A0A6C0AES2_9ZZZZ
MDEIYFRFINYFPNLKLFREKNQFANKHSKICLKCVENIPEFHSCEIYNCIKRKKGNIYEISKSVESNKTKSVEIACEDCTSNYILGNLLQKQYPVLNTIFFDTYKGINIYDSLNLNIDNLIFYDTYGSNYDVFDFARQIPNLKWILLDSVMELNDENYNGDVIQFNQETKLEGIMMKESVTIKTGINKKIKKTFINNGFMDSTKTWSKNILIIERNNKIEKWIVYKRL